MKYICDNCNEEFDINDFKIGINNSKVVMCLYCNFLTIEKNKYKNELNNCDFKEEDLKNVLEDIKAMNRLLKDSMEKLKSIYNNMLIKIDEGRKELAQN